MREEIERKIEAKFECLEENLKYVQEAQIELLSGLQMIRYLMYLTEKTDNSLPKSQSL